MPLYSFMANVRPLNLLYLSKDFSTDLAKMLSALMGTNEPLNLIDERYNEIINLDTEVFVIPVAPEIDHFIINHIKEAIHCYVLGLFIPCISLCGMVAELIINIKFEMKTPDERARLNQPKLQKKLLGKKFADLTQKRRIDSSVVLGIVNEEKEGSYDELRTIRNKYVHLKRNVDLREAKSDALSCIENVFKIVNDLFEISYDSGVVKFPPHVMNYLKDYLKEEDSPEIEQKLKRMKKESAEEDE